MEFPRWVIVQKKTRTLRKIIALRFSDEAVERDVNAGTLSIEFLRMNSPSHEKKKNC
jgi:hypothetical protein